MSGKQCIGSSATCVADKLLWHKSRITLLLKRKTDSIYRSTALVMDQASTLTAIVKPMIVEPAVDHRLHFTTDRKFHNRDQVKDWIGGLAKKLGFVAVTAKFDNGGNNRKPYIVMGCQRGGKHRAYINRKRESTTTLKCQCPFKVRSYCLSSRQWSVSVIEGTHNHKIANC
jgi:hypothetical protein